ncbi:MAG: cobalamin-dependent protein, partial [Defluviitaleaceae bacterium]|nr:cobalamin-dependent protein [Defluviitaleaceae bacterium]
MNPKILLMTPNIKGTKGGINRIQPPLGLGFLAAVLIEQGYEVIIRDTALEGYETQQELTGSTVLIGETDEQIAEFIRQTEPAIVGISITFSSLADSAKNIAKITKNLLPQTPVVVGGNHVTNTARDYNFAHSNNQPALTKLFEELILDENIDYAMIGEADFEFPKLVECLINKNRGGDISEISNLAHKTRG